MLWPERWFGVCMATSRPLLSEQDVVDGTLRVGALLDAVGKEAEHGRAQLTFLAADGVCHRAQCIAVEKQAIIVAVRDSQPVELGGCLVVFCLHQKMHVFDARVLSEHAAGWLELARPDFVVRGGGREYFRVGPPKPQSVLLNFEGGSLNGRLGDLGEGGLALWVEALMVAGLAPGLILFDVHLSMPSLMLHVEYARVCSLLAPSDDGSVRLGLEFIGVQACALAPLRRLLLAWQCDPALDHD